MFEHFNTMTLSDLVCGKDFRFDQCFHSIPSPTSRMIPYNDIFADFRGFPPPPMTSHSSMHHNSEVSPSCADSPQPKVRSPSLHGGIQCPRPKRLFPPEQTHQETMAEDSVLEEQRTFKCPQCRYVTDRKNNLKRHIVTMHQECTKTLECCGIVFQSKSLLRDHVGLFHRGGYRCQICSRNFCRKALLRRHLTVHSGRKDFSCDLCGYATSHKSNLERHQKVHSRKPASQAESSPRSFVGLSFDYGNIILEPAETMMTSHNSRLIPRYRLLPDRLKQTHANTKDEVQKKTKWKNRTSQSSKHQPNMLKNKNKQCNQFDNATFIDKKFGLPSANLNLAESKNNVCQIPFDYIENISTRQRTLTEENSPICSVNKHSDIKSSVQAEADCARDSRSWGDATEGGPKRPRKTPKTRTAKRRICATPYKCATCREIFCFQTDLSSHHCPTPGDDTISVITAIRKGKIKILPNELSPVVDL